VLRARKAAPLMSCFIIIYTLESLFSQRCIHAV
jgi:hypothetical protein